MLAVEELWKDSAGPSNRPVIVFNGEMDRIRSGCEPPLSLTLSRDESGFGHDDRVKHLLRILNPALVGVSGDLLARENVGTLKGHVVGLTTAHHCLQLLEHSFLVFDLPSWFCCR